MSMFGNYSKYYDLMYAEKDYHGEVKYIANLLSSYRLGVRRILDLGCGTGAHDVLLVEQGFKVDGVDLSTDMLAVAREKATQRGLELEFFVGDVRSLRLGQKYDAVLSLFHVMSYQTTNSDIVAAAKTAYEHLEPGGIFIFDCWYGPCVLTEKPDIRIRRLEDSDMSIVRISEPTLNANRNTVEVSYTIFITDKTRGQTSILQETHVMRYLFSPEIKAILESVGFVALAEEEWITGRALNTQTFSGLFVFRKVN